MRDGRAAPVGVHKEISRERQIAFGDHLVSKMQLFHTDMADEGLQHCLDGNSEFNPYVTELPENKPRPVLVEPVAHAASPQPSASPGASRSQPPGTEPPSASQGGASASRQKQKKKGRQSDSLPMQSLQPVNHFDDKDLYRLELQLWMHDQATIRDGNARRRQWVKDRGVLFGKLVGRLHALVRKKLETYRMEWVTKTGAVVSGFGYDELLSFLKEFILIGEGTQQFLPLFAVLDCVPTARQSTSEFKDKFCGLAARVSAPVSSGGMGPTISTKVLLTVLAVWRMQKLPEFAPFLSSVAKYKLNEPATYDKIMSSFDAQQSLVQTKVLIAAGAPKEPRQERPFQREPKPREKGKAFAAQGQDRAGWDPCTICGSPKHGVDFCFGPGGGREDKEKFLKSIQDRQRHFDSLVKGQARTAREQRPSPREAASDDDNGSEDDGLMPPYRPGPEETGKSRRATRRHHGKARMAVKIGHAFGLNKKHYQMDSAEFKKITSSVFKRDKTIAHADYAVLDSGATGNYLKPGFSAKYGIGSKMVKNQYIEQAAGARATVEREATAEFNFANSSQLCTAATMPYSEVTDLTENLMSIIERLDARTQFCLRHDLDGGSWMQLPGHAERADSDPSGW